MTEQEVETLQRTRAFTPTIAIGTKAASCWTRHTSPGARVAQAEPLFTIAKLDPLWVNIQVPSSRLGSIRVGSARLAGRPGCRRQSHSHRRSVDPATQSVTAVAQIDTNSEACGQARAVTARVRVDRNGVAQWAVPAASVVSPPRSVVGLRAYAGRCACHARYKCSARMRATPRSALI